MATFSPKRFAQPDFLKSIHPRRLIALLDPNCEFFKDSGVALPPRSPDLTAKAIDYDGLVKVFMTPDTGAPPELKDALYLINEMSTPEGMDTLLTELAAQGMQLDGDEDRSPGDVAVEVWLTKPKLLQRKHAEMCLLIRPRSYTTFRTQSPPPHFSPPAQNVIEKLESALGAGFYEMGRTAACTILTFPQGNEIWFLIGHGDPYRREGSLVPGKRTQVFYRPEKFDVVVYLTQAGELRANARSPKEIELYRKQFGQYLFGDESIFRECEVYTLAPLAESSERFLACSDIPGMEWVNLVEIQFWSGDDPSLKTTWWAENLVFALAQRGWRMPFHKRLTSAKFLIQFGDSKTPRSLTIRLPRKAIYTRDDDSECIEVWMRERGFISRPRTDSDAMP